MCLRQRKWLSHFPHNNHFQYLNTCAYLSKVGNGLLAYVPAGLVNMKCRNIPYCPRICPFLFQLNSLLQLSLSVFLFHYSNFPLCCLFQLQIFTWLKVLALTALWCTQDNKPSHLWHSLARVLSVSKCSYGSYHSEILYSEARANDSESPCYKTQLNNCIVCRARSETVTHSHTSVLGNRVCVSDQHLVCPKKQYTIGMTVTQREWEAQFSASLSCTACLSSK